MLEEKRKALLPMVAALAAGASFGFMGTVSQLFATQGFPVQHIAVAQFACATIVLGIISLAKRESIPRAFDVLGLLVTGILCAGSSMAYYLAIDSLSVGQAVAIQFQYVWMAIAIQCVVNKNLPNKRTIAAVVAVIFGTLLGSGLVDEAFVDELGNINPIGISLALGCALCYALFLQLNGKVALDQPPASRTFFIAAGACLAASAIAPDFYFDNAKLLDFIPIDLVAGLLANIAPCMCLAYSGKHLPGSVIAILTSIELPAAVLSGCLLLGESITPLRILGLCLILASVALARK